MRKARGVLTVMLVAGGLALAASPAGASLPGRNAKFCNAWSKVGSGGPDSTSAIGAQAKVIAKDYRKVAKKAPSRVAKALKTSAAYYDQLAKLKSNQALQDFALENSKAFQKSLEAEVVISNYVIKSCSAT